MNESAFGKFIRAKRIAAGLSLRDVADRLGVTHVTLGEVERGTRRSLKRERWDDLVRILGNITIIDLERQLAATKPVQMDLADATPPVRELGLRLARRIKDGNLDDNTAERLMRILSGGRLDE
jgi:transcriptional regulator with XRE-family HTH domain